MNGDFLLGLAALPIAAALIALLVFAVYAVFWMCWKNQYTSGFARRLGYDERVSPGRLVLTRANIIRAVADMGYVHRLFAFYGWTILIGRQPKAKRTLRPVFEGQEPDPFVVALESHYGEEAE